MRAGTRLFLLLGCALVVALEAPRTASELSAGWNGPYTSGPLPFGPPEVGVAGARVALATRGAYPVPRPRRRLELARR